MERSDTTRQHISDLVDGEAEPESLAALLPQLRDGDGRQAWDIYHLIGDAVRSVGPAPVMREDFAARFAARFAAEPLLLAPRRRLLSRLAGWPTTLAAVAAAGVGFVIAPGLMRDVGPGLPVAAPVASVTAAPGDSDAVLAVATPGTGHGVKRAPVAAASAGHDDNLDYISLHHSVHSSLYGGMPALQPAVLETSPQR